MHLLMPMHKVKDKIMNQRSKKSPIKRKLNDYFQIVNEFFRMIKKVSLISTFF